MKKLIKVNLIILIIFCLTSFSIISLADEIVEEVSQEKNLDDLEIEKNELKNNIDESNKQIEFIESQLSKTVVEISEITQEICDKEVEIKSLEAQEKDLVNYISGMEEKLEESNKKYEAKKELLEKRMVAMYEMGETRYIDFLFSARSISDFLSNYYIISEITKNDQELLKEVRDEKNYNKLVKENLEAQKAKLTATKKYIEKTSISLSNMAVIKETKIQSLSEKEMEMQRNIEEYQNQIKDIEAEIRMLTIANIGEEYVGGVMLWPVPGYTRITSPFGMRTHPITGIYKLHTGVDIGAPYDAIFIAANDGVVVKAGYNIAYGNMVIIDHGGGVSTLYAHGNEILVQEGEVVTRRNTST